jgi:hypothetical protein
VFYSKIQRINKILKEKKDIENREDFWFRCVHSRSQLSKLCPPFSILIIKIFFTFSLYGTYP